MQRGVNGVMRGTEHLEPNELVIECATGVCVYVYSRSDHVPCGIVSVRISQRRWPVDPSLLPYRCIHGFGCLYGHLLDSFACELIILRARRKHIRREPL